jgi:hypothetical protein
MIDDFGINDGFQLLRFCSVDSDDKLERIWKEAVMN